MRFVCKLIFCLCYLITASAQIPPKHFTRERTYDVLHYKLNVNIDEKVKTCEGDVKIKMIPLRPVFDEVLLDAGEMEISTVKLELKQLNFTHKGDTLLVVLDKSYGLTDTLNLAISYSVTNPRKGIYFITPDSGYPNKQYQVWTQGEAEDNHYWFPCYDFPNDRATSEMIVTVNDRFTAISNGKLLDVKKNPKEHTATYHWFEGKPHVSYLISLVVGEYVEMKDMWNKIPISYYVYKNQKSDAMLSFAKTPKMLEYFSIKTGYLYPWEKFAQTVVADFFYGGQENVSAVTLTDNTIHDSRAHLDYSSDGLVAHELAHQWFGDLISFRDWSHAWISEGFATYFENLFTEFDLGRDEAAKEIMDHQIILRNVDEANRRRPTVCNRYYYPMDLFDNRIYGKGAVVLNMLRFYLGDELFFKAIDYYVDKYASKCVETNDFKVAIEEVTGYNLHWFFDQWIYKAGCPNFDITSRWDQTSGSVQLNVKQVQKTDSLTGIFKTPVDIEVWVHGEPETHRVLISNSEETFSFPAYRQPDLIVFDKGSKILKKVQFEKSVDEWIFQLQHASDGVDRLHAIDELRWYTSDEKVLSALSRAGLEDCFWAVRSDAVWLLGDSKKLSVADTIIATYGDRDARVRTACIASLGNFEDVKVLNILKHAFEKDSSYSVAAAALRSLMKIDTSNRKYYCIEGLKRTSRNEIIRSTALQQLSEIGDEDALNTIFSQIKYGVDRNVRIQAINILASVWNEQEDVFYSLVKLLDDPSFHIRRTVIDVLGDMENERAINPLKGRLKNETDSRIIKDIREALDRIQKVHQNNH